MGQRDVLSVGFRLIGVMALVRGLGMLLLARAFAANVGQMNFMYGLFYFLLGVGVVLSSDYLAGWLADEAGEEMRPTGEWRIVSRDGFRFALKLVGAYLLCMRILPGMVITIGYVQSNNLWGSLSFGESMMRYGPTLLQLALSIYLLRGADFLVDLAWKKDLLRFPTIDSDDQAEVEE